MTWLAGSGWARSRSTVATLGNHLLDRGKQLPGVISGTEYFLQGGARRHENLNTYFEGKQI